MDALHLVLLVDCSPSSRATYRHWLDRDRPQAFTFLEAGDGNAALAICQQSRPDVVLLSDRLPDLAALGFLERLSQQTMGLPSVIILSEQEDVATAVRAIKQGAQDYLVKSKLTSDCLYQAVQAAIAEHQTAATGQQQADAWLRQSEAANHAMIQAIPDLLIRMTRDGECLDILNSPSVKGAYPACAVQDRATFAALFPDLNRQKLHYVQKALQTGELQVYEQELQVDEVTYFEEVRIAPSGRDEVLIIVRDITQQQAALRELKQTEAALRQSEATNRAIFKVIPDILVRMDRDGCCLDFVSGSDHQIFYPQGAAPGRNITDYLPAVPAAQRLHYIQLALETGELQVYDQEIQHDDGNRVEEVRIVPNGADEVLVIVRDVTARQQAEQSLQASEARFHAFMNNSPAASWMTDADGRLLYVSQTYYQIFSLPTQNVVGKTVFELFPTAVAQSFLDTVRWVIDTRQIREIIEVAPRRDGTMGQFLVYRFPLMEQTETCLVGGVAIDITSQLETEQALRQLNQELERRVEQRTAALHQSEAVLQAIFNQAAVGINLADANGRYLKVNQACCDILGYTAAEFLQIDFDQITHPEDWGKGWQERQRLFAGAIDSYSLEKRYIRKDGSLVWVNTTVSAMRNAAGDIECTICVIQDIHQRKYTELQLRQSEARYRAIVEDQTELIARFAPDTTLLFVNEAYCRYFGVQREAVIGTSYAPTIFEADRELVAQRVQSMSAENPTVMIENRLVVNGEIRWTQWINRMLFDDHGHFIEYQAVGRDITPRKQAEARLRQQLKREVLMTTITQRIRESLDLSTILNTTVAEIQQILQADRVLVYGLVTDGSGRTIAESKTSSCRSLLDATDAHAVLPPECKAHFIQGDVCILPSHTCGSAISCTDKLVTDWDVRAALVAPIIHQNVLWGLLIVHQCSSPRQWQDWEVQLLQQLANQLAIATKQSELYQQLQSELRERKLTQQLLEQTNNYLRVSNQELAQATRHKDEFLANMSHELRTPLNAILGMSEALLEKLCGPLTERQLKAITTIEKSGAHLLSLINDILDLAKIEAGKLELHITSVAIDALCDTSLTVVRPMADKKGIQLTADISPHIGHIEADDRYLQQVLINLLSNAVKFTPAGGSVTLKVWGEFEGIDNQPPDTRSVSSTALHSPTTSPTASIYCSVIDTGIGIAPEDFDQIFQPFQQVDSSLSRQYTGTGLGLTLVQRIVAMHQGQISVESKIGEGSRFTIRLPQRHFAWIGTDVLRGTTP